MTLTDLALGYKFQFGHDSFTVKCVNATMAYYPNYINAFMIKSEALADMRKYLLAKENNQRTTLIASVEREITGLYNKIDSMGYKEMPKEQYEQWVRDVEELKQKQIVKQNTSSNKNKK